MHAAPGRNGCFRRQLNLDSSDTQSNTIMKRQNIRWFFLFVLLVLERQNFQTGRHSLLSNAEPELGAGN